MGYPNGEKKYNMTGVHFFYMGATDSPEKTKGPRLLFIDNIRIFLICLVITTHSAVTYGGSGDWYYTEVVSDTFAPIILTMINSLNQSFFMGCFLFISAFFITGSLERKGTRRYVHDRLVRLGIPLLVWILFINPLLLYLIRVTLYNFNGTLLESYADFFIPFRGFGLGPMWFVLFLLIATLTWVVWYTYHGPGSHTTKRLHDVPSFISIIVLGIILGLITFAVRIFLPIGWTCGLVNFQLPFFPQYIAFFILGIVAAQNNWLAGADSPVGKKCALAALVLILVQPLLLLITTATPDGLRLVMGGLHWQAAVYAIWEQMAGIMIMVGLLRFFSLHFKHQGPVTRAMAADTYTVYIIHPVILVILAIALKGLMIPALGKFVILLALTICITFSIAHAIRALPGVKRIL
jgi:hypothetical protein